MQLQTQGHALDSLTSGDRYDLDHLVSDASTWDIQVVGTIEPTGEYAEAIWQNREMADGFCDPKQGFITAAEYDEELTYDDALAVARQGGIIDLGDQLDQGYSRLVLEPAMYDGKPNADAWAAARLLKQSKRNDGAQGWRHDSQIDLSERNSQDGPFAAEQPDRHETDWLGIRVNEALAAGGWRDEPSPFKVTHGLDGIDAEDLHIDVLAHLVSMAQQQADEAEREARRFARMSTSPVLSIATRQPDGQTAINYPHRHDVILRRLARHDRQHEPVGRPIGYPLARSHRDTWTPAEALRNLRRENLGVQQYRYGLWELCDRQDMLEHLASLDFEPQDERQQVLADASRWAAEVIAAQAD